MTRALLVISAVLLLAAFGRCQEHASQLAWVDASFPRQVAYRRQVAHYEQLLTAEQTAQQASLMEASR
jgi:hypothetical protein